MRFLVLLLLLALLLLPPLACKNNEEEPLPDQAMSLDLPPPDRPPIDDPFGRICNVLGKECPDRDVDGRPLTCIGVSNGAPGKGFCSRQCSDVGNECFGAPNGQYAACIMSAQTGPDAGPGLKFCGFLCKNKDRVWACPATLKCGPVSGDTALCVPGDTKVPDRGPTAPDLKVQPDKQGIPSNSGKICTDASQCAPGDDCLLLNIQGVPTPTQKMCVMSCKGGTSCPVPPGPHSSMCFLNWGTKRYCVWFCEYQGVSYQCPEPDAFQCVVPNSTEPGIKICIPK
jgi:hypothetical protein